MSSLLVITVAVLGMVLLFVIAWRTRLPPLEIPPNLRPEPDLPPYPRALWIVWGVGHAALLVGIVLGGALDRPLVAQIGLGLFLASIVVGNVGWSWQLRRFKAAKRREAEAAPDRATDVEQ
jgi:hypothetical protein